MAMNDAEVARSWREYLADFETHIYPIMQEHGFTRASAFQVWMLNRIANAVETIADHYDDSEDEEWKDRP